MGPSEWMALAALLFGGSGALWAAFKVRPERDLLVVDSAHKIVEMQNNVIARLEREIAKRDETISSLQERILALEKRLFG